MWITMNIMTSMRWMVVVLVKCESFFFFWGNLIIWLQRNIQHTHIHTHCCADLVLLCGYILVVCAINDLSSHVVRILKLQSQNALSSLYLYLNLALLRAHGVYVPFTCAREYTHTHTHAGKWYNIISWYVCIWNRKKCRSTAHHVWSKWKTCAIAEQSREPQRA